MLHDLTLQVSSMKMCLCVLSHGYIAYREQQVWYCKVLWIKGLWPFVMDRPNFQEPKRFHRMSGQRGYHLTLQDVIQSPQAIEDYIHNHVGIKPETDEFKNMYFNELEIGLVTRLISELSLTWLLVLVSLLLRKNEERKAKAKLPGQDVFQTYDQSPAP